MRYIAAAENQNFKVVELVHAISRGLQISTKAHFRREARPLPKQVRLVGWGK